MEDIKPGSKSLFSIQIDDIVIQNIFQQLKDEIATLRKEVQLLRDDVVTKPSRKEILGLSQSMDKLQVTNGDFAESITNQLKKFTDEFNAKIKETQEYSKKESIDAVFSINSVVRAQNTLIEEKIYELTKPTFEFEEMRRAVSSVKDSHESLKKELAKIRDGVSKVMEIEDFDHLEDMNLTKYIINATDADRENIAKSAQRIDTLTSRIETTESLMIKITRTPNAQLPQWKKVEKYDIKEKPKLPELVAATTFVEYLDYLMTLAPSLQKILSSFYKEITKMSNKLWESKPGIQLDKDIDVERINKLITDVEELKLKAISRAEVSEMKDQLAEMRVSEIPKLKLNKITNQLELLQTKVDSLNGIDEIVGSLQQNFDTALASAIREVQSAAISPNISPRMISRDLPAKTSVTPRATQIHKLIYGDLPQQKAQRPETRNERKPSLVRKPAIVRRNDESF